MDNSTIPTESLKTQEYEPKADKKSIKIKISIKAVIIIVAIIVLGALAYVYKGLFIAATVNGSLISRLTVVHELEKASGKNLLDSLISKKLIQNEADAKGISVSNDEISAKIKIIEDQIVAQGGTLDAALTAQGIGIDDLKEQIAVNIEVEKLIADKINVTDEEVAQYIKDNSVTIPKGQEAVTAAQIKDELRNQKLNTEGNALITALKSQAKIRYFVNY